MSVRIAVLSCLTILFTASALTPAHAKKRTAFVDFHFHEKLLACGVEAQLIARTNAGYATSSAYVIADVQGMARVDLKNYKTKKGSERIAVKIRIDSVSINLVDIHADGDEAEASASTETGGFYTTGVGFVVQGKRLEGIKARFETGAMTFTDVTAYAIGGESFAVGMANNMNDFKLAGKIYYKVGDKKIRFDALKGIMTCHNKAIVETSVLTTKSAPLR